MPTILRQPKPLIIPLSIEVKRHMWRKLPKYKGAVIPATAEQIMEIRGQMGLSKIRFAALLNISITCLHHWETGATRVPGIASLFFHMLNQKTKYDNATWLQNFRNAQQNTLTETKNPETEISSEPLTATPRQPALKGKPKRDLRKPKKPPAKPLKK